MNLEVYKHNLEYEGEEYQGQIDEIEALIEANTKRSIFEELIEIEKNADQLLMSEHDFKEALNYLSEEVKAFNSMKRKEKSNTPPEFAKFNEARLKNLNTIIRKPTGIKIDKYHILPYHISRLSLSVHPLPGRKHSKGKKVWEICD